MKLGNPNLPAQRALNSSKCRPSRRRLVRFRILPMAQVDHGAPLASEEEVHHWDGAVRGWGSLKGLSAVVLREKTAPVGEELFRQNKPGRLHVRELRGENPET
jgi:hypothetical protein